MGDLAKDCGGTAGRKHVLGAICKWSLWEAGRKQGTEKRDGKRSDEQRIWDLGVGGGGRLDGKRGNGVVSENNVLRPNL